jgi:antitoxin VapB
MPQTSKSTAKIFKMGKSQAIRLRKAFQFDVSEVFIRKDDVTGEVILSPKLPTWTEFFKKAAKLTRRARSISSTKRNCNQATETSILNTNALSNQPTYS